MSILYVYSQSRGPVRIFRDICELVAASSEICLDIPIRGRANSRPFIAIIYTSSLRIRRLGNLQEQS